MRRRTKPAPGEASAITAQLWDPAMRLSDVKFWVHNMAREMTGNDVLMNEGNRQNSTLSNFSAFITAKYARLYCPNGWGLSIVTMQCDDGLAYLHGDPRVPDYETMVIRPATAPDTQENGDDVTYDMQPSEVEEQLNTLYDLPFADTPSLEEWRFAPAELPGCAYKAERHGSFLYQDAHNLSSKLWANRVSLDVQRWRAIIRDALSNDPHLKRDAGLFSVNLWCSENCIGQYAWTGSSPMWVFEDSKDAILFKIKWG